MEARRTLGTAIGRISWLPVNIGVAALIVSALYFWQRVGAGRVDRPLLDKSDKPFVLPFQNIGR